MNKILMLVQRWVVKLILLLIKSYQLLLSPMLGNNCKFYPSCSCYAHQAVAKYGIVKGLLMTGKRLARCNPWSQGGIDELP